MLVHQRVSPHVITGFVCSPANVTRQLLEVLKDFRGLAMDIANLRMGWKFDCTREETDVITIDVGSWFMHIDSIWKWVVPNLYIYSTIQCLVPLNCNRQEQHVSLLICHEYSGNATVMPHFQTRLIWMNLVWDDWDLTLWHSENCPWSVRHLFNEQLWHLWISFDPGSPKHYYDIRRITIPICSMVLVYLPTWLGEVLGKCWDSYSSKLEHMGLLFLSMIVVSLSGLLPPITGKL